MSDIVKPIGISFDGLAPKRATSWPLIALLISVVAVLLVYRAARLPELNKALVAAMQQKLSSQVELLLSQGASANARAETEQTEQDWWEWIRCLFRRSNKGMTVLMIAADHIDITSVRLLLEHGADPYATDERGRRAIDFTHDLDTNWGHDVAELLLQHMRPEERSRINWRR